MSEELNNFPPEDTNKSGELDRQPLDLEPYLPAPESISTEEIAARREAPHFIPQAIENMISERDPRLLGLIAEAALQIAREQVPRQVDELAKTDAESSARIAYNQVFKETYNRRYEEILREKAALPPVDLETGEVNQESDESAADDFEEVAAYPQTQIAATDSGEANEAAREAEEFAEEEKPDLPTQNSRGKKSYSTISFNHYLENEGRRTQFRGRNGLLVSILENQGPMTRRELYEEFNRRLQEAGDIPTDDKRFDMILAGLRNTYNLRHTGYRVDNEAYIDPETGKYDKYKSTLSLRKATPEEQ